LAELDDDPDPDDQDKNGADDVEVLQGAKFQVTVRIIGE
jgi:hypothetical protein